MTWWHGSGRIDGDLILPPSRTGRCRSGDDEHQASPRDTPEPALPAGPTATAGDPAPSGGAPATPRKRNDLAEVARVAREARERRRIRRDRRLAVAS